MPRVGCGWDQHPFVDGRPLMLGGIRVPHARGLAGHSDGDVVCHAIADALLGAAGLSDLGALMPPGEPRTAGIAGTRILAEVAKAVRAVAALGNVDAVVIAQAPRLAEHLTAMREAIAAALGVEVAAVGLRAKSPEAVGALGRAEGIAAQAVALVWYLAGP